jgi:hypothetical protein
MAPPPLGLKGKKLVVASDSQDDYRFGDAIAVSETTIFVGATRSSSSVLVIGIIHVSAVYAYELNQETQLFEETQKIPAPNQPQSWVVQFGYALAVDGNILVVGDPL